MQKKCESDQINWGCSKSKDLPTAHFILMGALLDLTAVAVGCFRDAACLDEPQNVAVHAQLVLLVQNVVAHTLVQAAAHVGVADACH